MQFGDILRNLLEENELSQKQLAINLNIAVSTIGNYVRNTREPDFDTLKLFASYFSVSIDYLLNYQSENTNNHMEDEMLRVFRSLTDSEKELYLEQGKVFINHKKKKSRTCFNTSR